MEENQWFETEFQRIVPNLHSMVRRLNDITACPEKDYYNAVKQRMEASSLLMGEKQELMQLKAALTQYQKYVCIPCLNAKQKDLDEMLKPGGKQRVKKGAGSRRRSSVAKYVCTPRWKTTNVPKKPKAPVALETRMKKIIDLSIDLGQLESEASHVRQLGALVNLLDMVHALTLSSAWQNGYV